MICRRTATLAFRLDSRRTSKKRLAQYRRGESFATRTLLVAFGRRIRAGRARSVFQLALFFRFLLLLLLQLFAVFLAGVIRFGQSLFLGLLSRLGGRGVGILLLRSDCRLPFLLRFLLLVRLRRFIAHDAATSFAESRCQRPAAGVPEMRPRRQRVAAWDRVPEGCEPFQAKKFVNAEAKHQGRSGKADATNVDFDWALLLPSSLGIRKVLCMSFRLVTFSARCLSGNRAFL